MLPGKIFYTDRPKINVPQAYCSLGIPKLQIQGTADLPGSSTGSSLIFRGAKG